MRTTARFYFGQCCFIYQGLQDRFVGYQISKAVPPTHVCSGLASFYVHLAHQAFHGQFYLGMDLEECSTRDLLQIDCFTNRSLITTLQRPIL
jgi:hypothetical protein